MKEALESQIEQHREQHQKQVSTLRNEIEEKQAAIATLKDENQRLTLAFEQLQRDHERLKEDESEKSKRLNVSGERTIQAVFSGNFGAKWVLNQDFDPKSYLLSHFPFQFIKAQSKILRQTLVWKS